jgi:TRAP-type C4-dicarboxylate transport system permease small subunit
MHELDRTLRRVAHVLNQVGAAAMLLLTAFVVLSAFMRYFLGKPFNFTEELVGLLFMVLIFCALPLATVGQAHIRVTIAIERLSPRARRVAEIFNLLVIGVFAAWLGYAVHGFSAFSYEIGARTDQGEWPLAPWMAVMPLVLLLIVLIVAVQTWRLLRAPAKGAAGAPGNQDDGL